MYRQFSSGKSHCRFSIYMSRIDAHELNKNIETVLAGSVEKKRNFLETVELQLVLKGYGTKNDVRFNVPLVLPHNPRPNFKVCVLADAADIDKCKKANIDFVDIDFLTNFNKDAKLIKKFVAKYDAYLASKSLVRKLVRIVGNGFAKVGKQPVAIDTNDDLTLKVEECQKTLKIAYKKAVGLNYPVGNVSMPVAHIHDNIVLTLNTLVSQLKKGWQNMGAVYIKSTMGKPIRIY